jgi:hypothetical protein
MTIAFVLVKGESSASKSCNSSLPAPNFITKSQGPSDHFVAVWLLNYYNYRLEPHDPNTWEPTQHLILSHTWGDDEVTYTY